VETAGYELVLPPKELLSNATNMGHPQELWQWLRENAPKAKSAVIASDSMLYGGLIPSRKHEVSQAEIAERLENFKRLRQDNPNLHIYVFVHGLCTGDRDAGREDDGRCQKSPAYGTLSG
jgi:hypothetical protein